MAPRKCTSCTGSFTLSFFSDNSIVCRLCLDKQHLESRLEEQDEKLTTLTNTVASLQELIQANVAVPSPSAAPTTPAAAATVTAPSSVSDGFTPVRRGAKPVKKAIYPVHCYNRFAILTEEDDEQESTLLVGDSMIRQQVVEFCGRVPRRRRNYCYPGAGVDDIAAALKEISPHATNDSLFVIHTGTNDVSHVRSEELLEKYRRLIRGYKTKSSNILISGVLPRVSAAVTFYNKAFSLNNRLATVCREMDVGYVNLWDEFYSSNEDEMQILFQDDGLHLSPVGAARFGRLLHDAVRAFQSKNGFHAVTPPS